MRIDLVALRIVSLCIGKDIEDLRFGQGQISVPVVAEQFGIFESRCTGWTLTLMSVYFYVQ